MTDLSNLWNVLAGLLNVSLTAYYWVVIAAVIVSWIPLDASNSTARSILRFLRRATEPTFVFFRRTFQLYRLKMPFDITPIIVILAISFLRIFLVQTLRDMAAIIHPSQLLTYSISNFLSAILYTISSILSLYFWIVILAVVVSWIPLDPYHPLARAILYFLRAATEPVFGYLRRKLNLHRYTSPLDVTPMIVIILIMVLQNVVIRGLMHQVMQLR